MDGARAVGDMRLRPHPQKAGPSFVQPTRIENDSRCIKKFSLTHLEIYRPLQNTHCPPHTPSTPHRTRTMPGQRGPVPVPLHNGTRDLTLEILETLETTDPIQSSTHFPQIAQAEIKAALDRLASRSMVEYDTADTEVVVLTGEGSQIANEGSHEYKVWKAVKDAGSLPLKELPQKVAPESAKVGQGNAFKLKWIKKDGDSLVPIADSVEDSTQKLLQHVQSHNAFPDPKQLKDYQKRKLVTTQKLIAYTVRKGPRWAKEIPVEVTDLTAEMLEDGSWKSANFKPYNFKALGASQGAGALHPLNKVREEFRKIFFNWDFIEMPTARYVLLVRG